MTLILALMLILQQVQVEARVNRDNVALGETLELDIRVEAAGSAPVQILNPSLAGLELLGSTDQSNVTIYEGVATRILTRTLRLRATRAGTASIGTTIVRVGELTAQADPIEIQVEEGEEADVESLAPHILDMVERHTPRPRSSEEVLVEVLTSTDSVVLGEQLELVVVAWFPQQVRAQLRTPPTLRPPELQGAWTYSERIPHAVDLRRRIGNSWYQIYVHSVVVFPLTPGVLRIGPATVSYSLPMSYSFLSREVRHEPQSDSVLVYVGEQPLDRRPASFSGAAGSGLRLSLRAEPSELSVGEASAVTAALTGEGNVALWPEPRIIWPLGVRAYPEGVEVVLEPDSQRITGTKTFRYLVVPDSSGTHTIGPISYPYYDTAAQRYSMLRVPELALSVGSAATSSPVRRIETRVLIDAGDGSAVERLFDEIPLWFWLLISTLVPALAGFALVFPGLRARHATKSRVASVDRLRVLEREFAKILRDLVGDAEGRGSATLASALRAAGIDAPIASHAARARERLWQISYGPKGELDPEELNAEISELLKALAGTPNRDLHKSNASTSVALLILVAIACSLQAQSAEHLYEAGAFRAAADSFAARANAEPWNVAHWYNLGAALERTGEPQQARRAWIRAARRAPRDSRVRRAIGRLPTADPLSERLLKVAPVTPAEAILAATVFWVCAWISVGVRARMRLTIPLFSIAAVCLFYGMHTMTRYRTPTAIVITEGTRLRVAPYGLAESRRELSEAAAVIIRREAGQWILVDRGALSGWLMRDEVVLLP